MDVATTTASCLFLPTEMIREIFGNVAVYKNKTRLSQTCKRFKKILALEPYSHLNYQVRDGPCLIAIREIVFTDFASRIRDLEISPRANVLQASTWKGLSSVVAACVPRLPSLTTLSLHPQLLDNLLLHNIILSTFITSLILTYPLIKELLPLKLLEGSLLPRPIAIAHPLHINGRFAIWVKSRAEARWVNQLLLFLGKLAIGLPSLELIVVADLGPRSHLLLEQDLDISQVLISTTPPFVLPIIPWIASFQESDIHMSSYSLRVRSLRVSVTAELAVGGDGLDDWDDVDFALDGDNWIPCSRITGMNPTSTEEDLFEEWWDLGIHSYSVGSDGDDVEAFEVELAPGHTLNPPHLLSLAQHLKFLSAIQISSLYGNLSWSDWPSTVLAFSNFERLRFVTFTCSFTPAPSLLDVLSCPTCEDQLPVAHPQLHRDAQLVGGSDAVWNAILLLNLSRLELLAQNILNDCEVSWTISNILGDPVASRYGVVRHQEGRESFVEVPGWRRRQRDLGVEGCMCTTCVGMDRDPVMKLKMCPVDEVRAALVKGGFDLATFDASPVSADAGPDSLEVFLRSGAPHSNIAATI